MVKSCQHKTVTMRLLATMQVIENVIFLQIALSDARIGHTTLHTAHGFVQNVVIVAERHIVNLGSDGRK